MVNSIHFKLFQKSNNNDDIICYFITIIV